MRILYVVSKWNQNTETFVRREVAAAVASGCQVEVVSLKPPGESDGIVDESSIVVHAPRLAVAMLAAAALLVRRPRAAMGALGPILRLGRPGTWPWHLRAWIVGLAVAPRVEAPDIVLAHFAWVSSTAADVVAALRCRPFAVFAHAHGIYETRCADRYLADRLQRALALFVESDHIADDVRRRFDVDPIVMRMGVPSSSLVARPRPCGVGDRPLVVSVGALREKKGHDTLVSAISSLDGVSLVIAGEGPLRSRLLGLISDLGVTDRVDLIGHRTQQEVHHLLDRASVFCLASRVTDSGDRDGVPNVLIEAMARGVPVIATSVSGIPDLLADDCGLVVPPDDAVLLAQALGSTLQDTSQSMARAERALGRVRRDYTTERNWERLSSTLTKRLASWAPSRP